MSRSPAHQLGGMGTSFLSFPPPWRPASLSCFPGHWGASIHYSSPFSFSSLCAGFPQHASLTRGFSFERKLLLTYIGTSAPYGSFLHSQTYYSVFHVLNLLASHLGCTSKPLERGGRWWGVRGWVGNLFSILWFPGPSEEEGDRLNRLPSLSLLSLLSLPHPRQPVLSSSRPWDREWKMIWYCFAWCHPLFQAFSFFYPSYHHQLPPPQSQLHINLQKLLCQLGDPRVQSPLLSPDPTRLGVLTSSSHHSTGSI